MLALKDEGKSNLRNIPSTAATSAVKN